MQAKMLENKVAIVSGASYGMGFSMAELFAREGNNAAIGEQKMIDETDDEWLEHVYQTNVFGPFRFIREALKVFLPKNDGCIINISSVNGDRPFCGASYTSSKGAILYNKNRVLNHCICNESAV